MFVSSRQSVTRGFTLIELMIVVAIIGLLLSFSLAGITSSRVRSRDTKRLSDLRIIQSALEQHALVYPNQPYPPLTAGYCGNGVGIYNNPCFADFIGSTPLDPEGLAYTYVRPACLYRTDSVPVTTIMTNVVDSAACQVKSTTAVFSPSYGLHALLERDNQEASNDRSPDDARSYDLMP